MIGGIGAALSGLQAAELQMQNTAHNVANVNTDGFKKGRVLLSEQLPQGVKATVEQGAAPKKEKNEGVAAKHPAEEPSNVALSEEIPEMMVNRHAYSANLKTIETVDHMFRSLLDITT